MAKIYQTLGWILLFSWMVLSILAFFIYPGRVSLIHQIVLAHGSEIQTGLGRIEPISYMLDLVTALAGIFLHSAANLILGYWILRWMKITQIDNASDRIDLIVVLGTAYLIGQAFTSVLFLILLILQILRPWMVLMVIASGLASGLLGGDLFSRIIDALRFRAFPPRYLTAFERMVLFLCILLIVEALLYSSARLSYDAVSMYFTNAKLMALSGGILYARDGSFLISSLHLGVQYAALIQVFGDQTARLISWSGGIVIIIFLVAFARKFGLSHQATLIAVSMCLTSTAFYDLLGDGKIDLMTSAYSMAAVFWFVSQKLFDHKNVALLVGMLAGYSIISRPFNAFLLAILFGSWVIWGKLSKAFTFKLIDLIPLVLGVGLWIIFHVFAAWKIIGNPMDTLQAAVDTRASAWQWSFRPQDIWLIRLLYPFMITFVNSAQSLGNISPLILAFLPGILSVRRSLPDRFRENLLPLSLIAAGTMGLWLLLSFAVVEIRYIFFLWAILFLPTARLVDRLLISGSSQVKWICKLLIIAVVLYISMRGMLISFATYSPVDREGNAQCHDSLLCEFIRPLNDQAPKGSRVLILNAYRYYMRSDLLFCGSNYREYRDLQSSLLAPSPRLWEKLYEHEFQYISYEKNYAERHMGLDFSAILESAPNWVKIRLLSTSPDGDQRIYEVNYSGREPIIPHECSLPRQTSVR